MFGFIFESIRDSLDRKDTIKISFDDSLQTSDLYLPHNVIKNNLLANCGSLRTNVFISLSASLKCGFDGYHGMEQ